jgi:hypothetical protein
MKSSMPVVQFARTFLKVSLTGLLLLSQCHEMVASDSNFNSVSDQVANKIESQKKRFVFPKVLVIDMSLKTSGITALSSFLADDLSSVLEAKLPAGTVIPRARLLEFLSSAGLSPYDLQSVSVAYWAADQMGANEIIFGDIFRQNNEIVLEFSLLRLGDAKDVTHWNLRSPLNGEIESKIGQTVEWPLKMEPTGLALRCPSDEKSDAAKIFLASGGTFPKAVTWVNPPFSESARRNRIQGTRKYEVFWDDRGYPIHIIPYRPLVPELDAPALDTIKHWKVVPATIAGKPVAACTTVEVNWRLY